MQHIEKELKFMLTSNDFHTLQEYLAQNHIKGTVHTQTNYYIDNDDFYFKKNGISARIRKNSYNEYEFTFKKNKLQINNVHIKDECTRKIEPILGEQLIANINSKFIDNLLENISIDFDKVKPYKIIGNLKTTREFYQLEVGLEPLNLDINEYLGLVDYELEWETGDIGMAIYKVNKLFQTLNIKPLDNKCSKSSRFIKAHCNDK